MVDNSDWQHIKQQAFDSFEVNGRLEVHELEQIVEIGCGDGDFEEHEKAVLINIITNMTRADLDDLMWAKVAELISKFELEDDSDATIEKLEDEDL